MRHYNWFLSTKTGEKLSSYSTITQSIILLYYYIISIMYIKTNNENFKTLYRRCKLQYRKYIKAAKDHFVEHKIKNCENNKKNSLA